jgi:uncharacterized membrane protein YraQ (UPF0718 family)
MELVELLIKALGQVWTTLLHNWPFLVISTLVAAAMKLYVKTDAVAGFLKRHQKGGVLVATGAAVATPLCSCGTTAIILGMMAGSMPWAPIIAFMVASPLTSPQELIYSAGLFGWPFASAFFGASIALGLAGGAAGALLDSRGWLRNQSRFGPPGPAVTGCECATSLSDDTPARRPASAPIALSMTFTETWNPAATLDGTLALAASGGDTRANACCDTILPLFAAAPAPCACSTEAGGRNSGTVAPAHEVRRPRLEWQPYLREVAVTGRRLSLMFLGFATIGYLINDLIPTTWITALFGSGRAYSVPLAATLGLPFYIYTEASLPLVRGMLDAGMSSGAALAFLITGAGTSIGAIAGAMTIARWRVVGLVIGTLWLGAVLCGLVFDALASGPPF